MREFRGALREHCENIVLPGLENDLTALTNFNRAGHGNLVRKQFNPHDLIDQDYHPHSLRSHHSRKQK
jgi:hypothetical protein